MLDWIKSFFTAQDNTKKPLTDIALNYQARVNELKNTSIKPEAADNTQEKERPQTTKHGKVWIQT
jgi:hypothetical protein